VTSGRSRTLPIRRWLALALAALFLAPILTLLVIGFIMFRPTHGPVPIEQRVEERLEENVAEWEDPAWQADLGDWLAGENVDVVLVEDGAEVYRSSAEPLAGTDDTSRFARQLDLPGNRSATIYADQRFGPPEELRQWFVPVALIAALALALGGIAWFLRRSILEPITATSEAAGRVAAGELDISLPGSRVREVAELNAAFERMSAALRRSLGRQERMEGDRRMFISALVHDLRTPLFSLRGSLEGLATGVADTPEKRARYIAIAQEKADALERLITDLFAYTRMEYLDEAPRRAPVELAAFLPRLVEGMRPRAETKGVRLAIDSGPARSIPADEHLLTRALENLLDNALRHTPAGGEVRVGWRVAGDNVEIEIADTGSGMPEEDLPRIFDPLYRGEGSRSRKTGGAGLGLTVARRIVQQHGGDLSAANGPAAGAVFTATLPAGAATGYGSGYDTGDFAR
jgi:signal transduction histidine kinase